MVSTLPRKSDEKYKFSAVYIVTGDTPSHDYFQFLCSAISLKITNPGLRIVLVTDHLPQEIILNRTRQALNESFRNLVCDSPFKDASYSNRYLKIRLPYLISDDYLYIDNDTFVLSDISSINKQDCSIAGCINTDAPHGSTSEFSRNEFFIPLKWTYPTKPYINCGILFFANNLKTKEFSDSWYKLWNHQVDTIGKHNDQPSFNATLIDFEPGFRLLPQKYNCQLRYYSNFIKNSFIYHYYGSGGDLFTSSFFPYSRLLMISQHSDQKLEAEIAKIINNRFPLEARFKFLLTMLGKKKFRIFLFIITKGYFLPKREFLFTEEKHL